MITDDDLAEMFAELCATEAPIVPLAALSFSSVVQEQNSSKQTR